MIIIKFIDIKKIENNIIRIREIFYREHANLYLILGEKKNLLIDTGIGILDISKEIEKISSNPPMVLNTHCHYDHCGGNKFFETIYTHALEKKCILHPNKQNTASFLVKNSDFILKPPGFNVAKYRVKPAKRVISLKANQIIDLGDFKLKVLYMPGHSPGSICFYEPDKKFLFSGDIIYRGKLFYNLPFSNTKDYLNSLRKLSKLKVNKCFPGHNEPLHRTKFNKILKRSIQVIKDVIE